MQRSRKPADGCAQASFADSRTSYTGGCLVGDEEVDIGNNSGTGTIELHGPTESPLSLPNPGSVHEQLDRILADDLFHRSKRYTDLLRFIVERTLDGKHDDLRERTIGHELFGRALDYDVIIDPTVRVVSAEVRKRLASYYKVPGREKEIQIQIPLGGYAAEFTCPSLAESSPRADEAPGESSGTERTSAATQIEVDRQEQNSHRRIKRLAWIPIAAAIVAMGYWGFEWSAPRNSTLDQFWGPLIEHSHSIAVYVSSEPPASTQAWTGDYLVPMPGFGDCCDNVPMLDVKVSEGFSDLFRKDGVVPQIRPARMAAFSDLSARPALLIGLNNIWIQRLGANLRYRFNQDADGKKWIEDSKNPSNRDWLMDMSKPAEIVESDYAVVSRVHDATTGHWWISVAGLTGAATLRTQEFLVDRTAMTELAARLPKDWKNKNLQAVFSIRIVQRTPGRAQVVAVYSW